jgi:hypothetical protein
MPEREGKTPVESVAWPAAVCVRVRRVGEAVSLVQESAKTARERLLIVIDHVPTELINHDHDDERRPDRVLARG